MESGVFSRLLVFFHSQCFVFASVTRRQAECAKTARIQMALPIGKPGGGTANNLYEELGDNAM